MLQRKRHKTESTHFQKVNEKRGIGRISKEKPKKTTVHRKWISRL